MHRSCSAGTPSKSPEVRHRFGREAAVRVPAKPPLRFFGLRPASARVPLTLNPLVVGSIPTRPTKSNERLASDRFFWSDLRECLRQEMSRSHPCLQRAEGILDGLPAHPCLGCWLETGWSPTSPMMRRADSGRVADYPSEAIPTPGACGAILAPHDHAIAAP